MELFKNNSGSIPCVVIIIEVKLFYVFVIVAVKYEAGANMTL